MRRDSDESEPRVIAILGSDYHLSHKPPIARSVEPSWYAAMARPLKQIENLMETYPWAINCIAGDIFHKARGNDEELIHFALSNLPYSYAIPGQHDLPHHNWKKIRESAYHLLARTGKIIHIDSRLREIGGRPFRINLYGFGWEKKIPKRTKRMKGRLNVALVHRYVWKNAQTKYTTASETSRLGFIQAEFRDFDAVAFGDNHIGFTDKLKHLGGTSTNVINCGSLLSRTADQKKYKPQVGLLCSDGSIRVHPLDTSEDKWATEKDLVKLVGIPQLEDLIEDYKKLRGESYNFLQMLRRVAVDPKQSQRVQRILLEVVEEFDD